MAANAFADTTATPLLRSLNSALRAALRISRELGLDRAAIVVVRTIDGIRYYAVSVDDLALAKGEWVLAIIEAPASGEDR
jgi:hypothetical protein